VVATIVSLGVTFLAQALVIAYPPVFVFWILIHTRIDFWRKLGKRAYWYACLVWPLISGPLLFWRQSIFSVRWSMPWWITGIGLVSFVLALWVGRQSSKVISRRTLLGLVELEPQRNPQPVMQTGIYGRTRNPVYLTHWLLVVAAAALSGYAANWILLASEVVLIAILIRVEEKELLERYGSEFASYMQRVPRFIPK